MTRLFSIAAVAVLALSHPAAADDIRYEAAWHSGEQPSLHTTPLSRQAFLQSGQQLAETGWIAIDVETAIRGGRRVYAGLWTKGTGSNIFEGPMGPIELREARERHRAQGHILSDFEMFRTCSGGRRYVGIWINGTGDEVLTGPMQQDAFFARGEQETQAGKRLKDVEVEVRNGTLLYSGLFQTGTGSNFLTAPLPRGAFTAKRDEMVARGLELTDVERVTIDGTDKFVGVWSSGGGESRLSVPRDFGSYFAFAQSQFNAGKHTEDFELQRIVSGPNGTGDIVADATASTIHIARHDSCGEQGDVIEKDVWSSGWTFVREFNTSQGKFLFILKQKDGNAQVLSLNEAGSIGGSVESYSLHKNVTSAEIHYPDGDPVLVLHERQRGRIATWAFGEDGRITGVTSDQTRRALKHKDVVKPFRVGNNRYLFALDRWYGGATIFPLTSSGALSENASWIVNDKDWTTGWSSATFFRKGGNTFLILYKVSTGRIGVKRMNADGTIQPGWFQKPGSNGYWQGGWTHFAVKQSKLFMYKRHKGRLKVHELSANGIGAKISDTNIRIGWTDIGAFKLNGNVYLAKLNEEGRTPFDHNMAERFRDVVVANFGLPKTAGYQFGIMQSGKIVMLHADGWAKRSAGKVLTTKARQDTASVSKMITTASILRLIDDGAFDLDDRMTDLLPAPTSTPHGNYGYLHKNDPRHPTLRDIRISELLTYTARFGQGNSQNVLSKSRKLDKCDDNYNDESWDSSGGFRCKDVYQNSPFGVLGAIIANQAGLPLTTDSRDSEAYDQFLADVWMREANVDGMKCGPHTKTAYYKTCNSGPDCIDGYREFVKDPPKGYCSSGNWAMSTEDALQFMSAMRYGKVLSSDSTDYLFSHQVGRDGEADVEVGWNKAEEDDGGYRYGKAGGGGGVSAYVMHFPRGVDAVILVNTKPCNGCGEVRGTLTEGYGAAIAP